MANEDITKKDLVNELKDLEEENDQKHLEPVNVIIGRFQPLTIGHLGMAKELEKINGLPSVYIYIRSKSGDNSKFSDRLTSNYMEDVVKGENLVRDAWSMTASFIPVIIKETQRRGYNPVLIGAGEDRFHAYSSMAKRMKDIQTHPDFKIQELKGRLTSATEVRQAILDDDKKKFMKLVPKEVQPYYKHLKDELDKSHSVVESISVINIIDSFNYDIEVLESILQLHGEDFFSDPLIIESIIQFELDKKLPNNMKLQEGNKENEYKFIKSVIKNKVSLPTDKQYSFAKKYIQDEYGKGITIEGIGVDKTKIYLSLNSSDGDAIQIDIDLPKDLKESMSDIHMIAHDSKDFEDFKKNMKKEYPKMKDTDLKQTYDEMMAIEESTKISSDSNKFLKGMKIIKLDKKFAKSWMPGIDKVYFDEKNDKYYFVDSEGLHAELSNKETLKYLKQTFESIITKEEYTMYHDTFGSVMNTITKYISESNIAIDKQTLFENLKSPKLGQSIKQIIGGPNDNINIEIYNNDKLELTIFHNKIRRGLKEYITENSISKVFSKEVHTISNKEELYDLIKECFGNIGIEVYENISKIHYDAINKSHTRVFDRAIKFRNGKITLESLESREVDVIRFLAKINESKLEFFKNYLTEMMASSEYEAKLDAAISMIIKTNRPVVWEDFKSSMIRSEFFKKDFKPFLMMQGLSDFQIERFIENILRVKYQHYTNYFMGSVPLQYITK